MSTPKYGYKAIFADGSTQGKKGFQYNLNESMVYKTDGAFTSSRPPKLCSGEGFHYCDTLEDVFDYYPYSVSKKPIIYYKIEILDKNISTDGTKSCTRAFKFLEAIPDEVVKKAHIQHKIGVQLKSVLPAMNTLVETYPDLIIAGSAALVLQGISINRHVGDLDVIHHSYINIAEDLKEYDVIKDNIHSLEGEKPSYPSDADGVKDTSMCPAAKIRSVKIDLAVNPWAKYTWVTYGDRKYKVAPWLEILSHKMSYAMKGRVKDIEDFKTIIPRISY